MGSELELEQWSTTFAPAKPCYSATSIRIGENVNEKDNLLSSTVDIGTEVQENNIAKMLTIKREIEDDEYLTGKLKSEAIEDFHITSPPPPKVTESGPDKCLDTPRTELFVQPQPVIPTNDFVLTEAHLLTVVNNESKETLHTENEVYDDLNRKSKHLDDWDMESLFEVDETCSTKTDSMVTLCGVNILQSILDAKPPVDTIISCADGKLGAHRIVITAASQFLGQLFADQRSEDIAVIILPNINKHTMISLLNLAYTGRMVYKLEDQDAILDAMHCLRFGNVSKLSLYPVVINDQPLKESKSNSTKAKTFTESTEETVSKLHGFEQEEPSGKSSSNGSLSHQPKPSFSTFAESSKSTLASKNKKKLIHVCPQCPRSFATQNALQFHVTKMHAKNYFASIGEMQMLSFCDICDRQYKTINRATFCYAQHGLSRCLCCLGLYPTTEIKDHYQKTHASFEGNDVFVKCRWCPRTVSMKNHCANIVSHSNTHWPNQTAAKVQNQEETTPKRPNKCRKRSSNKAFREATPSKESKTVKQKKLKSDQMEAENQKNKNGGAFYIGQQSQIISCAMDRACNNSQIGNNRKKETTIDLHNLPKAFVKLDPIENIQMYIKPNYLIELPLPNHKKEQEETKVKTFHDVDDCNQDDDEMSSKEKVEDNIIAATSIIKNLNPMENNVVEAQFLNDLKNNTDLIEELNTDKPRSDHEKIRNTNNTKDYSSPIIGNNPDMYNSNELKPAETPFVANYDPTSPVRNWHRSLSKIKVPLFPLSNPLAKVKQSGFTTDLNEHHGTNWNKTDTKDCHLD